jgi:hypothetical protein
MEREYETPEGGREGLEGDPAYVMPQQQRDPMM